MYFFGGRGGAKRRSWGSYMALKHKKALISEYLAADLSADASADALAIINIGKAWPSSAPVCLFYFPIAKFMLTS